jgi:SAM-dependent methyltransferase
MTYDNILESVGRYYSEKIQEHGATARGVDWNSPESQRLRFAQLLKICGHAGPFSINDYGCGYGALVDYLSDEGYDFEYRGFDISEQMVEKARELHAGRDSVAFSNDESLLADADYTVTSGIFNVRLETPVPDWESYLLHTLDRLANLSRRGFSFNALSKYSDKEFMRPDLYYADPLLLFDYCKVKYSRFVSLLHDYPLYEFTILVRKS